MTENPPPNWVSSKKILKVAGISRATLNNYIRWGLLPRPELRKPENEPGGPKRIGYFPSSALERIDEIRQLKQAGKTLEQIVEALGHIPLEGMDVPGDRVTTGLEGAFPGRESGIAQDAAGWMDEVQGLHLTFREDRLPAYFLDGSLRIRWMNRPAELDVFGQKFSGQLAAGRLHIFKVLFHWEFHDAVLNWKDFIRFHMACARYYLGGWNAGLAEGALTESEARIVRELSEDVAVFGGQPVQLVPVCFLKSDGLAVLYRIHIIPFKEGLLFLMTPERCF